MPGGRKRPTAMELKRAQRKKRKKSGNGRETSARASPVVPSAASDFSSFTRSLSIRVPTPEGSSSSRTPRNPFQRSSPSVVVPDTPSIRAAGTASAPSLLRSAISASPAGAVTPKREQMDALDASLSALQTIVVPDSVSAWATAAAAEDESKIAAAAAAGEEDEESKGIGDARVFFDVPQDWSVKTHVRILSDAPIGCRCLSFDCSAKAQAIAKARSVRGGSGKEELARALLCWRHPEQQLSLPLLRALQSSAGDSASSLLRTRWQRWVDALLSCSALLRRSLCPLFYVVTAKQCFLFRAADEDGESTPFAAVSSSSLGMRRELRAADVPFTCPLRDVDDDAIGEELVEELKAIEKEDGKVLFRSRRDDGKPETALLFRGQWAISGLVDYLLQTLPLQSQLTDVPLLLSTSPFEGCTLQRLQSRCSVLQKASAAGDGMQERHVLDISGPLLPPSVQALSAALFEMAETAEVGGSVELRLDSEALTAPFNRLFTAEEVTDSSVVEGDLLPSALRTLHWTGAEAELRGWVEP